MIDEHFPESMKALKFASGVVRTPATDLVIEKLDTCFSRAGKQAVITSVLRTREKQLQIIQQYAVRDGIIKPGVKLDFAAVRDDHGKRVPLWQWVWSSLLNRGIIISPPIAASPLLDYIRDGVNKKGKLIQPSEHFVGIAFDIGGGPNGVEDEYRIISRAALEAIGIRYVMVERQNNCVHTVVL